MHSTETTTGVTRNVITGGNGDNRALFSLLPSVKNSLPHPNCGKGAYALSGWLALPFFVKRDG